MIPAQCAFQFVQLTLTPISPGMSNIDVFYSVLNHLLALHNVQQCETWSWERSWHRIALLFATWHCCRFEKRHLLRPQFSTHRRTTCSCSTVHSWYKSFQIAHTAPAQSKRGGIPSFSGNASIRSCSKIISLTTASTRQGNIRRQHRAHCPSRSSSQ